MSRFGQGRERGGGDRGRGRGRGRGRDDRGRGRGRGRGRTDETQHGRGNWHGENKKRGRDEDKDNDNDPMFSSFSEEECGILCYVSPEAPAIQGIIKQRVTDFLVHEVDENGEVVRLTDTPGIDWESVVKQEKAFREEGPEQKKPRFSKKGQDETFTHVDWKSARKAQTWEEICEIAADPANILIAGNLTLADASTRRLALAIGDPAFSLNNGTDVGKDLLPELIREAKIELAMRVDEGPDSFPANTARSALHSAFLELWADPEKAEFLPVAIKEFKREDGNQMDVSEQNEGEEAARDLLAIPHVAALAFHPSAASRDITFMTRSFFEALEALDGIGPNEPRRILDWLVEATVDNSKPRKLFLNLPNDKGLRKQVYDALKQHLAEMVDYTTEDVPKPEMPKDAEEVKSTNDDEQPDSQTNAPAEGAAPKTIALQLRNFRARREMRTKKLEAELGLHKDYISKDEFRALRQTGRSWPSHLPGYLEFVICKWNRDTMKVTSFLASQLGVPKNVIGYAGTKDKRGVTVQRMTVPKTTIERLAAAVNVTRNSLTAGNFRYVDSPLQLGQLSGNRFDVVLRNIAASDEEVRVACEAFRDRGFGNFYGLQRFGTGTVRTSDVGLAMLKCNWRKTVELILGSKAKECPQLAQAKEHFFSTGKAREAADMVPFYMYAEKDVLRGIAEAQDKNRGPEQFLDGIMRVSRNLQLMYLHAYQSLIWNKVASRRIQEFGVTKPIVGDLVALTEVEDVFLDEEAITAREKLKHEEGDVKNLEDDTISKEDDNEKEPEEKRRKSGAPLPQVRALTEEDIANNTFTIEHVVLPLPGVQMQYPENKTGAYYKEYVEADGITLESFNHKVGQFRLGGGYRKLVQQPKDLEWSIVTYSDPKDELIETDIDLLKKPYMLKEQVEKPKEALPSANFRGLKLSFTLPSSCYATICLRELMKQSTSIASQMKLNTVAAGGIRSSLEGNKQAPKKGAIRIGASVFGT